MSALPTFEVVTGEVVQGDYSRHKIRITSQRPHFLATLELTSGDADLFVSFVTEDASLLDWDVFEIGVGNKTVPFYVDAASNPFAWIAVRGYSPVSDYTLRIESSAEPFPDEQQPTEQVDEFDSVPGYSMCSNCTKWVPDRTMVMHEAFCRRNNEVCQLCRKVMRKGEVASHWHCDYCNQIGDVRHRDKHMELVHKPIVCECGSELPLRALQKHRKEECPDRKILCRFCHLLVKAGPPSKTGKDLYLGTGLTEHESSCGARTIQCVKCNAHVQLKDVQLHMKLHDMKRQTQTIFRLCSNKNCSSPENFVSSPNVMRLCQTCYAPFYSPRHDEGNKKLQQKVLAKYHHQLTVGCGRTRCWNKYCCTSKHPEAPNEPKDPNGAAATGISLLLSSGLQNPGKGNFSFYFCVAEGSHRRYIAETQLSDFDGQGNFSPAWCVKAMMETGDDVDAAANWLIANAPTNQTPQ